MIYQLVQVQILINKNFQFKIINVNRLLIEDRNLQML